MVYFYNNLKQYLSLPLYQKLQSKIQAKSAMDIEKDFQDTPMIDIRNLEDTDILVFNSDLPNYMIRKTVGEKVIMIAKHLQMFNYQLKIYEIYQSLTKQKKEFEEIKNSITSKYPTLSDEEIYIKTIEFIADPNVFPPHTTGGALDVCILDNQNNILDMGSPINHPDDISHFYTNKISPQNMINRYILRSVFLEYEFAPLATEWWHFSYGDNYWAAFYNKKTLYKSIDIQI